jgi:hypothetical protein
MWWKGGEVLHTEMFAELGSFCNFFAAEKGAWLS